MRKRSFHSARRECRSEVAAMCRSRALVLLCLLCSSLHDAICMSSDCVRGLPQSMEALLSLVKGPSRPHLTLRYGQFRLLPNVTFTCSGSIVGWSMITSEKIMTGGRPVINTWNTSDGREFQRSLQRSLLLPCLKGVVSDDDKLYLHENITETPLEFQSGDILGLLLRNENMSMFHPYFIEMETYMSYYRAARNSLMKENLDNINFNEDIMMPLLFLHICSREDDGYEACMEEHSSPTTMCKTTTESPPPDNGNSEDGNSEDGNSEDGSSEDDNSEDGVSNTAVIVVSVAVPVTLVLLIVLVLTLVCVRVSKRRRRKRRRRKTNGVPTVTEYTDVVGAAQPYYAEPYMTPSPLPYCRAHTPLPPPPTDPPPPPGLSVQPAYAVLDGPTPSPPPPYILNLEHTNRPPTPEYESIDKKTGGLQRQNATETSVEGDGYDLLQQRN